MASSYILELVFVSSRALPFIEVVCIPILFSLCLSRCSDSLGSTLIYSLNVEKSLLNTSRSRILKTVLEV
jgi:hypothetical protein